MSRTRRSAPRPRRPVMTAELARAIALDAATDRMRRAGRRRWSRADYEHYGATFAEHWPLEAQYPWMAQRQIAALRRRGER